MTKCSIPHCTRPADGNVMFKGHQVCLYHETRHWKDPTDSYIWKKLGLYEEMKAKERQMEL